MNEQFQLIDVKELSRRLAVARGTIHNWVWNGTIPGEFVVRLGGHGGRLRFRGDRVPELVERLKQRPEKSLDK